MLRQMTPVLFLDIDGVLLSGRAWLLPANRTLQVNAALLPLHEANQMVGREAVFDACAVALVNRICVATGAQIVIASTWRYTVGPEQTLAKLLGQGIAEAFLHPDWACSTIRHGSPDKTADIFRWLEEHGVTHFGSWLVLDDEDVVPGSTLRIDALEGLGARDAAAAIRYLGGTDAGLGVGHLSDEDVELVAKAFNYDTLEASRWLEGAESRDPRRHRPSAHFSQSRREEGLRRLEVATAAYAARKREIDEAS